MSREKEILRALKELVKKIFPGGEGEVYLYGSRSKGFARKHSDWDLLILLDDKMKDKDTYERYVFPFAELGWEYGEQITPLFYLRSDWEQESKTVFYNNVINSLRVL